MSDTNIDQASEVEALFLANALAAQKRRAVYLKPTGYCKYCSEALAPDMLFCDTDCRDDYEADMKRKNRG